MWKHYLKIAWRNIKRNKTFSIINILGLSIGLACSMLIVLYVKDENSFDKFHKNGDQIYRVISKMNVRGDVDQTSTTGLFQGPKFAQNVPGIKGFVRYQAFSVDVKIGSEVHAQNVDRVDSNFFSVFTFPLIAGNAATCLKDPYSLVLSEDAAIKQFGTVDAIGKVVMLKDDNAFVPYRVSAVAKNCPQNSSIRFDALSAIRVTDAEKNNTENWFNSFLNTFVVLEDNANLQDVEKRMQAYFVKDAATTFNSLLKKYGMSAKDVSLPTYRLQAYTDMHLDREISSGNGIQQTSSPVYSYILSAIALFILLIACINFINLTVARSVKRAKEIGIRKVVGGGRKQLIKQFLGEALLFAFIAFGIALLLTYLMLPLFNRLSNKSLSFSYLIDIKLIVAYVLLFIITGLLAGFYPAIVLSRFDPIKTLYNRFHFSGKNYLQRSLIVMQFVLASFLIIITFVLFKQFNFLTHADLGYDDSNIVVVNQTATHSKASVVKRMLLLNPNIANVAAKNAGNNFTTAKISNDSIIKFRYETVDEKFLSELKIPMIQGRGFSPNYPSDSINSVLVNQAFVKEAGWENPIGQTVNFVTKDNKLFHVVGVVKDYHYASMNEPIGPQLFTMDNGNLMGDFYIKIKPNTETESLKFIQKTFNELFPLTPYSYKFKNDENRLQYGDIERWRQIVLFGAVLTIFISLIGLFGLSVMSSEKRKKEIGIRKVYGASVKSIIRLLTSDFLRLVLLALFISAPLAWLGANKFLQSILYKIPLTFQLFLVPDLLILLFAFITIYIQTNKSARANPIKSLKTE